MRIKRITYFIIPFLVCALVFSFALACGDSSNDVPKKVEDEEKKEEVAETEEAEGQKSEEDGDVEGKKEEEYFEIGDDVDLGGTVVTVTNVEKSSGGDFDKPKEGMEYVIVSLRIYNNSDEKITYNPFDFEMQNSKGQITEKGFAIVDTDTSLSSGELVAGGEVEGTIAFEEPIDDPGLVLIYSPSFWDDDEVIRFNCQ